MSRAQQFLRDGTSVRTQVSFLKLTATTTGAGQTVTLQQITPTGGTCDVDWGDGGAHSTIANGNVGTTTHVYASAGTYAITISNPLLITRLDLQDTKLRCVAGNIGKLTNLTYMYIYNLANITIGAGEVGGLTKLTFLYLYNVAATIGASETGLLTNLATLQLITLSSLAFQTGLSNLKKLTLLRYRNSLSQAQVDNVLSQMYTAFPTRTGVNGTIDVSTNAAPSGTLGAACPPTTGKEYAYELVNDSCGVSANHWATVTINPT